VKCQHGGRLIQLSLLIVPAVWLGLLIGVSFIATPVKFLAPSLSLQVALDVGRATFAVWNIVEWAMLGIVALLAVAGRVGKFFTLSLALLLFMMLIQTFYALPILNQRVATIIAGGRPDPSSDHLFYIVVEVTKLQVLGVLIWWQGCRLSVQ
jgi:hypothetical protein